MTETALIRAISRWTAAGGAKDVIASIGDDCAIIRPRPIEDLLLTTDLLVEDVHFRRATHTPAQIGAKCMARGLSDIAAMGGEPRVALLSLALGSWMRTADMRAFYRGATSVASRFGVQIVGGDLTRADRFSADIVVIGAVPRGRALRRNTARPGDGIYVTGPLGRAAASGWRTIPEPRIEAGLALRRRYRATACMDLSDGLSLDLHRMMEASGVSAELNAAAIPCAPGATLEQAVHGGEDYELLCTLPPTTRRRQNSELIPIGFVTAGKPGYVRLNGRRLAPRGWDPFRR